MVVSFIEIIRMQIEDRRDNGADGFSGLLMGLGEALEFHSSFYAKSRVGRLFYRNLGRLLDSVTTATSYG